MISISRACTLAATLILAACGGGGSGGTVTGTVGGGSPQSVTITESNAKPVSANALDSAQSTSATRGATGLPVGVQVGADGAGVPTTVWIAELARLAVTPTTGASLPTGVVATENLACPLGGSLSVTASIANGATISVGDSFAITATNCSVSSSGTTATLNGQLSMTFQTAVSSLTPPFHVVASVVATNLSVTAAGVTAVANGDVHLDWTASSSTTQTMTATGTSMSTRETINGVTHTITMRSYSQTLSTSGSIYTASLSATIETDSSKLGTGTVSYTITTPTPVVWSASTRAATAGVIKVVGANNAALLITIASSGTVTIQIDANGDGTYEKTITSTTAELAGLV